VLRRRAKKIALSAEMTKRSVDIAAFVRDVRASLSTRGPSGAEIEFRIGTKRPRETRFRPGVDRAGFERVLETLESSKSFVECPRTETMEYYFSNMHGRLSSDGSWTEKEKVSCEDYQTNDSKGTVRASLAYEIAKSVPYGASPSSSAFFRKKSRRSFAWTTLPWRVDMTEIESNEDKDSEEKTYEIEIELADPSIFYVSPADKLLECGANIARDLSSIAFSKK
jgi:hypothetical protein